MNTKFILIIVFFSFSIANAQKSGKGQNQKLLSFEESNPKGSVAYRQKLSKGVDNIGFLVFNDSSSLYYFQRNELNAPSLKQIEVDENEFSIEVKDKEGISYFKKRSDSTIICREFIFFTSEYVLRQEINSSFNWLILDEFKTIGRYQARKAKGSFRGRDYIVWFTYEIPLNLGPWRFFGLPGLILEAYDTKGLFSFEIISIDIPARINTPVIKPLKGRKIVGWENYKDYVKKAISKYAKFIQSQGAGFSFTPNNDNALEIIN